MKLLIINALDWCPEGDLNPHDRLRSADFKSAASADFAIRAWWFAGVISMLTDAYSLEETVKNQNSG